MKAWQRLDILLREINCNRKDCHKGAPCLDLSVKRITSLWKEWFVEGDGKGEISWEVTFT